jgi:hypothetical protein
MIWRNLLIEREVADADLAAAMADIFGMEPASVLVVDDFMATPHAETDGRAILVDRRHVRGDAALDVEVFLIDRWEDPALEAHDEPVLRALAERLASAILTDDGTPDPSCFLRYLPSGEFQPVLIDDDRLDGEGYVAVSKPGAVESRAV